MSGPRAPIETACASSERRKLKKNVGSHCTARFMRTTGIARKDVNLGSFWASGQLVVQKKLF